MPMKRKANHLMSYFDILEACAEPGCPLCRLSERSTDRYLASVMGEYVNDSGTRAGLRRSLGYCNEHAWRLPDTGAGAALGIAIVYLDLLTQMLKQLRESRFDGARKMSLRRLREMLDWTVPASATEAVVQRLHAQARCPACARRETMERIALVSLLEALAQDDQRMLAALEESSGLCLPHLRQALELVRDRLAYARLVQVSTGKLGELTQELREFIRKVDYRFNQEDRGAEQDSWQRAIAWMSGARGMR